MILKSKVSAGLKETQCDTHFSVYRQQVHLLLKISIFLFMYVLTDIALSVSVIMFWPSKSQSRRLLEFLPRIGRRVGNFTSKAFQLVTLLCVSTLCVRRNYLTTPFIQDGPKVLQNVSFHIKAGERIGIGL